MTTPAPFTQLHLDDLDPIAVAGVRWLPLRYELGVSAFGINAYRADAAGERLIEEHDELGGGAGGHEEAYAVVSGHATFTVAGREIDAPAGTVVFVRDPAARRGAVARAAGTTALVVGGQPGAAGPPSAWEFSFRAAAHAEAGDVEAAAAIVADGLAIHLEHPSLLYNLACYEALGGRRGEALEHIARAAQLEPRTRDWAADDRDLDAIRDDPAFPRP